MELPLRQWLQNSSQARNSMSKEKITVVRDNLYTFLFAPYGGMLKSVEKFTLEYMDEEHVWLQSNENDEHKISLKRISPIYKSKSKIYFILKALFIPIVILFLLYAAGARFELYIREPAVYYIGLLYFFTTLDMIFSLWKIKDYEQGLSSYTKNDFYKVGVLILSIGLIIFVMIKNTYFGFIEITTMFSIFVMYYIYMEYIKKPILILLSSNVYYWKFKDTATRTTKILISPKIKFKEKK